MAFDSDGIGGKLSGIAGSIGDGVRGFLEHIANFRQYYEQASQRNSERMKDPRYAKRQRKKRLKWFSYMLFPVLIFYYEMVFHFSTIIKIDFSSIIFILLFSCVIGWLLYLIRSFIPFRKGIICTDIMMFIAALPYLIEFFIFKKFQVFYDLNTITNGAGGALTEFSGDIIEMVFSFGGMLRIILYLLPLVIYPLFIARKDRKKRMKGYQKVRMIIGILVVFILNRGLIAINGSHGSTYSKEYNYQTAIGSFGLLTGIRLDIQNNAFGGSSSGFEAVSIADEGGDENLNVDTEDGTEVVSYGLSQIDSIDFTALAESASGTLKEMDEYCATLTASSKNEYTGLFEGKNLIFISAEAFTAEAISEELTPTLYRMATKGINFTDYHQPATAGTTGGEYQNIYGLLPTSGGKSMKIECEFSNYFTMGMQLNRLNYNGWAFHNNTYTFYSRDVTHNKLGYSNGYMGYGNGMEEYVTKAWPESDLEMIDGTVPLYIDQQPFNVYYMSVSGHGTYGVDVNAQSRKNWDRVADLDYSDTVKAYIAANLTLEDAMASLVQQLEDKGIADDTVIVIAADHFPYGLDDDGSLGNMPYLSELYGYDVTDYVHRDHNRLIIWSGCLEDDDPIIVDEPTSSLDIVPTLSNLFGTEWDSRLFPGRDVFSDATPLYFDLSYDWETDKGTYIYNSGFTPKEGVEVSDDYVESVKAVVRNKIQYCKMMQEVDFYGHVMGVSD